MKITKQTRQESYLLIQPKRSERKKAIYRLLEEYEEMTAREIAEALKEQGVISIAERNCTAPRLTEMKAGGVVCVAGKKRCSYTGRTVAVWKLKKPANKKSSVK